MCQCASILKAEKLSVNVYKCSCSNTIVRAEQDEEQNSAHLVAERTIVCRTSLPWYEWNAESWLMNIEKGPRIPFSTLQGCYHAMKPLKYLERLWKAIWKQAVLMILQYLTDPQPGGKLQKNMWKWQETISWLVGVGCFLLAGWVGHTWMERTLKSTHIFLIHLFNFATFLKSTKNIWVLIWQQYNNGTQGPIYQEPQQELSLQSCLFTIIHHCSLLLCSHKKTQQTNKYNNQTNSGHNRINSTQLTHSMQLMEPTQLNAIPSTIFTYQNQSLPTTQPFEFQMQNHTGLGWESEEC